LSILSFLCFSILSGFSPHLAPIWGRSGPREHVPNWSTLFLFWYPLTRGLNVNIIHTVLHSTFLPLPCGYHMHDSIDDQICDAIRRCGEKPPCIGPTLQRRYHSAPPLDRCQNTPARRLQNNSVSIRRYRAHVDLTIIRWQCCLQGAEDNGQCGGGCNMAACKLNWQIIS